LSNNSGDLPTPSILGKKSIIPKVFYIYLILLLNIEAKIPTKLIVPKVKNKYLRADIKLP